MLLKVVHPRVKRFLRSSGVLVLDRLGHSVTTQLAWQTGAQLISAPFSSVCTDHLGHLSRISHLVINKKSYACCEGGPRPAHTLVLCALSEEAGEELKHVSNVAHRVLLQAVREQVVLVGAGVWQQHAADYVRQIGRERSDQLAEQFGCCRSDVINVTECIADSLQTVSQLVQTPDVTSQVLDVASVSLGGLKTAVSMTQSLLKLQFHTTIS